MAASKSSPLGASDEKTDTSKTVATSFNQTSSVSSPTIKTNNPTSGQRSMSEGPQDHAVGGSANTAVSVNTAPLQSLQNVALSRVIAAANQQNVTAHPPHTATNPPQTHVAAPPPNLGNNHHQPHGAAPPPNAATNHLQPHVAAPPAHGLVNPFQPQVAVPAPNAATNHPQTHVAAPPPNLVTNHHQPHVVAPPPNAATNHLQPHVAAPPAHGLVNPFQPQVAAPAPDAATNHPHMAPRQPIFIHSSQYHHPAANPPIAPANPPPQILMTTTIPAAPLGFYTSPIPILATRVFVDQWLPATSFRTSGNRSYTSIGRVDPVVWAQLQALGRPYGLPDGRETLLSSSGTLYLRGPDPIAPRPRRRRSSPDAVAGRNVPRE